jgi:uncharacterized protein YerC
MKINYKNKFTDSQLSEIIEQIKSSTPYRTIQKKYGINSIGTIHRIKCAFLGSAPLINHKRITIEEQLEIIELIHQGVSYREICKRHNLSSTATVSRLKLKSLSGKGLTDREGKKLNKIMVLFESLSKEGQKSILQMIEKSINGETLPRDCRR